VWGRIRRSGSCINANCSGEQIRIAIRFKSRLNRLQIFNLTLHIACDSIWKFSRFDMILWRFANRNAQHDWISKLSKIFILIGTWWSTMPNKFSCAFWHEISPIGYESDVTDCFSTSIKCAKEWTCFCKVVNLKIWDLIYD